MEETADKSFTVNFKSERFKDKKTEVQLAETTDGLPYYKCHIDGKEVQLRKDEKWEQIWGDLHPQEIEMLGTEIDKHIAKL